MDNCNSTFPLSFVVFCQMCRKVVRVSHINELTELIETVQKNKNKGNKNDWQDKTLHKRETVGQCYSDHGVGDGGSQ